MGWCYTHPMRTRTIVASLGLLLLCSSAHGNDTFATLGAGGLVPLKTAQVVMESEDLQISSHQIVVRYVFRNITNRDVDAVVTFPLPDLSGGDVYNEPMTLPSASQLNFVDFTVTADGIQISPSVESRALLNGRDITGRLQAANLPVSVLLEPLNAGLLKLSPAERKRLETEELIVPGDFNPPLRSAGEHGWWAAWTMRVKFYWTQHFPAQQNVELAQTYRPVVGGSYVPANDSGRSSAKRYCGGPGALREIAQLKQRRPAKSEHDISLWERTFKYILTTANNWSGPVRQFHLTVLSDTPEDLALTCMPGLKKSGDKRYELSHSNWRPAKNLGLMILQTNKPEGR